MDIELRAIKHLANSRNIKVHHGVLHGTRIVYFKGKRAVTSLEACKGVTDPLQTIGALLEKGLLCRIERVESTSKRTKHFEESESTEFNPEFLYTPKYDSTSAFHILGSLGFVILVLAAIMFPLWPHSMQIGGQYLSYVLLCFIVVVMFFGVLRLVIYIPLRIIGRPGWLFPNLLADVGIIDSFRPVFAWEK